MRSARTERAKRVEVARTERAKRVEVARTERAKRVEVARTERAKRVEVHYYLPVDSIHAEVVTVIVLLLAVTLLSLAATRVHLPYPTVMVLGGLGICFIPHLPVLHLEPQLIFLLFLPPLLYAAAWYTSWRDFRANLRPIALLAVGFVLFTTVAVGAVAHAVIPNMPWAAAFTLGAIISPPDAVAATAIANRLGIPRRIITVLEGESLVNDATGLTIYRFAVAAAVTGTFSLLSASELFLLSSIGGVLLGLVIGMAVARLHMLLDDPIVETVFTLLTPFAAYLIAEDRRRLRRARRRRRRPLSQPTRRPPLLLPHSAHRRRRLESHDLSAQRPGLRPHRPADPRYILDQDSADSTPTASATP